MRACLVATALLLVLVLCCGCFEYSQEIWVNKDYSGRIVADFGLSEQLVSMSSMGGGDPIGDVRKGYEQNKAKIEADPNVKSTALKEETRDGYHHFILDVSLKDITKLGQVGEALEPDTGALSEDAPRQRTAVAIERIEKGDIRFSMSLSGMATRGSQQDDPFSGMGQAMMLSMFSGQSFSITLHAPGPISGNGKLSEDKRTATWEYSMGELIGGKTPPADIEAVIDMPDPLLKLLLYAGAGLGLIALVLIVLGLTRKRKPRTTAPEPRTETPAPPTE
jgi:hypothetical protein